MANISTSKLANLKNKIREDFQLNTQKVTLIALFLALTTLISLFEIPTFFNNFLTVDFGNTILLLAVIVVRWPYALLIAIVAPWIRLVIPHTIPPNVVGELANMLSSMALVIIYCLLNGALSYLIKNQRDWRIIWTVNIVIALITCVLISLINVFFNWAFILDLYGTSDMKALLWPLFFPYNLFKFTFVLLLFLILKKPLLILKDHFNL